MGSGDNHKHHLNFHIHMPHIHLHHHHNRHEPNHVPKGCVAILVGIPEEQQRFIVPVMYMNHPLFMQLLKEAEEEYGFDHNGPINIPCHVKEFRHVQAMIDKEKSHHHYNNHHSWCFKA